MFSVPLQIHPCRASLDAVVKWRPNTHRGQPPSPPNNPLLPTSNHADGHGSPKTPMSDVRFAILTTIIIAASYTVALSVSSLDRVLAYVGSTGSTSISFILPGLFYYKISDPNGVYYQRLAKEDDDANVESNGEDDAVVDIDGDVDGATLRESTASLASGGNGAPGRQARAQPRRKWRWDLEHVETGLLRRLALCLAVYGFCVMIVCLTMNTFFIAMH